MFEVALDEKDISIYKFVVNHAWCIEFNNFKCKKINQWCTYIDMGDAQDFLSGF